MKRSELNEDALGELKPEGMLSAAATALRAGKPVVFPTDTVYGIGVAARYAPSPRVIYDIKHRVAGKPIAWLVSGPDALAEFGKDVPSEAFQLAERFWPGALTLIVKASSAVPAAFQSQAGTIGLRMPASETALALIRAVGPLATSSANLSGGPDPCTLADVDPALLAAVAVVVDDTCPASGVASTVVDCTAGQLAVLRQGSVHLRA